MLVSELYRSMADATLVSSRLFPLLLRQAEACHRPRLPIGRIRLRQGFAGMRKPKGRLLYPFCQCFHLTPSDTNMGRHHAHLHGGTRKRSHKGQQGPGSLVPTVIRTSHGTEHN